MPPPQRQAVRRPETQRHGSAAGRRPAAAADYPAVGASLFAALAAVLGDEFDAETREAWEVAHNLMAETMLDGAASARPVGR